MKHATTMLAGIALGCCMVSTAAQATTIQSMTIEEIGVISSGLGTSTAFLGGGGFAFSPRPNLFVGFTSMGSTDGAILMGAPQGDNAFTPGFLFAGTTVNPNTLGGAPSGIINGNKLTLNLSGWGVNVSSGYGYFPLPPDIGTLITSASPKDVDRYFYTADWSHHVTDIDDPSGVFVGLTTFWHLEGVATVAAVPEPGTAWLVGATLIGSLGTRRRKPV